MIQAKWKAIYQRKLYLQERDKYNEYMEKDF